ncbi:hypothetical protein V8G54_003181 [Vigna mungo]|uniref:Purple acid phosphatase n=1 Tax=Vigna mungo TaxID=3915 RepID=A0AAQ3PCY3_VIGMU
MISDHATVPFFLCFFIFLHFHLPGVHSKPSLSATPTTLSKSGDFVHLQWSGVEGPSDFDFLAIYSPPTSPHDNFVGYRFLSESPTWESGSGNISFPLVDLRSNYSFRIFRWTRSEINPKRKDHDNNPLPSTRRLLAFSGEVAFAPNRGPGQIHLAFGDQPDAMRVMYVTPNPHETYVRYGEKEDALDTVLLARVERYEREHMCDAPANSSVGWRDPGYIHNALLTDLKKGHMYYYKDESLSTMKWILRDVEALGDKPAFISHIGDISYARGYSWLWDHFFSQIEPVASKVAYHVCIGNHEYDWPLQPWKPDWATYGKDGGGECGVPYSLRFNMPGNSSEPTGTEAPPTRNLYYSFDMGAVHFVYISTETNFLPGSNQYNFLKHDLESVDRNKTPFVVVQGHRPMYTTSHESRDAALRGKMLEHLEPLFVNNKVSLALWGHVHRYERFCALNNFTCGGNVGQSTGDKKAYTVHIVIGMAGQDWQPTWEPRPDHPNDPIFPQPNWSLYRGGEFGYTRLVASKQKLVLSYVGNHDGIVHDMVEILASGEVVSGNGDCSIDANSKAENVIVESTLSWYVKGGSVLFLGAFMGYVLGFVTSARKRSEEARSNWTPVKTTET